MKTETINPKTPLAAYQAIKENAKRMPKVRDCSGLKIGQTVRQGDVYIERVQAIEGKGAEVKNRQLAPGTTNGSRHIVADNPHVLLFKSKPALESRGLRRFPVQIGPAIEAKEPWTLTHPSHPFCAQFPAGSFQVWFQIDPTTKQRVQD